MKVILRNLDKMGRITIPSDWRKNWGERVIMVKISDKEILIRPLRKRLKLSDLFDAIEIEVEDFSDVHKVRGTLYG
ncbi:MAG: hypothetical protein DRO00_03875 [Thermoproteota archaeon]|nr:MAG: hypothetical protein DRO00_03875 [Candidatus Korarchaeota archaeon]